MGDLILRQTHWRLDAKPFCETWLSWNGKRVHSESCKHGKKGQSSEQREQQEQQEPERQHQEEQQRKSGKSSENFEPAIQ